MTEATMSINGHLLTFGQSMTIRVALEAFAADLFAHGCGDDEHGKAMTAAYQARIAEIREVLYERAR